MKESDYCISNRLRLDIYTISFCNNMTKNRDNIHNLNGPNIKYGNKYVSQIKMIDSAV